VAKLVHPARKTSLSESAYQAIRQAIIRWDLKPGAHVSELQLSTQYGLGRAAVRASLVRLTHERLLQAIPRRGYIVAPITFQQIQDTFGVRLIVEPAAAAILAARPDEKVLAMLDEMNDACRYESGPYDATALRQANRDFHVAFVRATGNERLAEITSVVLDDLQRMLYLPQLVEETDTVVETWAQHQVIIAAIRAKDVPAAEAAALAHVNHNKDTLIQTLLSSPSLRSLNLGSSLAEPALS
jgi:DNA-binding GntR family transcriptional regulator